jgi:hypothetical protein
MPQDYRKIAIRLLKHYFAQVYRTSGLRWESDMDAEMEELVDAILAASQQNNTNSSIAEALNSGDGSYRP